jgi:hypothetical protein
LDFREMEESNGPLDESMWKFLKGM